MDRTYGSDSRRRIGSFRSTRTGRTPRSSPPQWFTVAIPQTRAVREVAIRAQLGLPAPRVTSRFECGYLDDGWSALVRPGCRLVVRDQRHGEAKGCSVPWWRLVREARGLLG